MLSRGIEHNVNYIDIVDPPAWFFDLSPLGQVPLLRLNEEEALFESSAICEYLNEVHGLRIWSEDPKERALERAMVGVSSACLSDLAKALSSEEHSGFARSRASLRLAATSISDVVTRFTSCFLGFKNRPTARHVSRLHTGTTIIVQQLLLVSSSLKAVHRP